MLAFADRNRYIADPAQVAEMQKLDGELGEALLPLINPVVAAKYALEDYQGFKESLAASPGERQGRGVLRQKRNVRT